MTMHQTPAPALSSLSDEELLVLWDAVTERADRYGWGPKTTAEVERVEAEVNARGLSN